MITLNFASVQELVFQDPNVQALLIECQDLFQQWKLGQIVPALRPTARKAELDLLNRLTKDQIRTLENYWGKPVEVERLDYSMIKTLTVKLEEAQDQLAGLEGEIFLYRDADNVYIGAWK